MIFDMPIKEIPILIVTKRLVNIAIWNGKTQMVCADPKNQNFILYRHAKFMSQNLL